MRALITFWLAIGATVVCAQTGPYVIDTAAGSSWVGDGGPAILGLLFQAEGVAADSTGNLYVADAGDHRVRQIGPGGIIRTVAGTGARGFSGDGGQAAAAQLNAPYGVAVDGLGDIYVADLGNGRVRRIAPDRTIQTVATLNAPRNLAVDRAGNLYIADFNAHRVYRLSADGTLAVIAGTGAPGYSGDGGFGVKAQLAFPAGLAIDNQGALYISDTQNRVIRKVAPSGIISTYAQGITATGLAFDPAGRLYAADPVGGRLVIIPSVGSPSEIRVSPHDVASSSDGNLYASTGDSVRRFNSSGGNSIIAGSGDFAHGDYGPALQSRLNHPSGVAMDAVGNLFIADRDNHRVRRVSVEGTISTVAGMGVAGNSGDGGLATSARLNTPNSVALDAAGDLYIADTGNGLVRVVSPEGRIHSIAAAGLVSPVYALPDSAGNTYIADDSTGRILRVGLSGSTTVLAGLKSPRGLAFDAQGNLYFTEAGAAQLRRWGRDGTLTNIGAGVWKIPRGVSVDALGRVFVADTGLQQVLRIDSSGQIVAVAGNRAAGFSGDGGDATDAQLSFPWDVTVGPGGSIAIADLDNQRVRMLKPYTEPAVVLSPTADAVNAASLVPGPVAPGMLLLLRNTGVTPAQILDAQILFAVTPAQVISAGASGILIFTPAEISATEIEIRYKGAMVGTIPITVTETAPGLFADASGQAAATNQDGRLNSSSNPSARGSVISLFGTGLGKSAAPVSVRIGGYSADILYAGPVSGYPGLFQVNARVPAGYLAPGNLDVSVNVGSSSTQTGVKVWVE